jgi:thymidylate kinase
MEQKGTDFHQKVRDGFLQLTEHKNVVVIDAGESIDQVHQQIIEAVGKIQ